MSEINIQKALNQENPIKPKMKGSILPGTPARNKKGNPNMKIGEIAKTQGTQAKDPVKSFWRNVDNYSLVTTSKIVREVRKCDVCPLGPINLPSGKTIQQCKHYRPDRKKCVIPVEIFLAYCKALKNIEDQGLKKAALFNAMRTSRFGELAFQKDILTQGGPSQLTLEYQKVAGEQLHNLLKVIEGEKQNINMNQTTLDIQKLMKEMREEGYDDS